MIINICDIFIICRYKDFMSNFEETNTIERLISVKYYDFDLFLETSLNGDELYEQINNDITKLNVLCSDHNYDNAYKFYHNIKEFEEHFDSDIKYQKYLSECIPELQGLSNNNHYENVYSQIRRIWFKEIIMPYTQWLVKCKQEYHIRHILKKLLSSYMSTQLVMIYNPTTFYENINNIVLDFIRFYKLDRKIVNEDLKKYDIDGKFIEEYMNNLYKVMDGKNMLDFELLYMFEKIVVEQCEGKYIVNKKKLSGLINY